jgi:hypothetical protein
MNMVKFISTQTEKYKIPSPYASKKNLMAVFVISKLETNLHQHVKILLVALK